MNRRRQWMTVNDVFSSGLRLTLSSEAFTPFFVALSYATRSRRWCVRLSVSPRHTLLMYQNQWPYRIMRYPPPGNPGTQPPSTPSACDPLSYDCLNRTCSGIRIGISWLIRLIRIRLSVGSLPKCSRFIPLSASVILPSFVKSGRWLYEKCQ